ncbi:Lactoylglutathione lyase [Labilithrix luteola]|uniref:Lactoylglutathione lyase n=1 Tax=Labilithrix luteola TaxID=1391654 RepID=A0A0K1PPQ1_9BACT|nr:VOC family protein [Labilithrix luteola]AKU95503.1 Lactoylglutathione lyase [Labilithrix luteola]
MFDHLGLAVKELKASVRFYQAVLAPLGFVLDGSGTGFGPPNAPALWLYETTNARGTAHVAFRAANRKAVERFHQEGLKAGARDNGKPGVRADYSPNYYAAFLIDPDGNNVEAVYLGEEG